MILAILISLTLGIGLGWYAERLLRYVTALLERKPVQTGVVRTEVAPGTQPQKGSGGVVRPKSPKEVAAQQQKEFNDEFGI